MNRLFLFIYLLFAQLSFGQQKLFPVAQNGKWGLIDHKGTYVLAESYDFIEYFSEANRFIYSLNSKKGVINGDGVIISDPVYEQIVLFDSTWSAFRENNKWGLMHHLTEKYAPQFDSIAYLNHELFLLFNDEKGILYNSVTQTQSSPIYLSGLLFNTSFVQIKRVDGKYDVFDHITTHLIAKEIDTIINVGYKYTEVKKEFESTLYHRNTTQIVGEKKREHTYQFGSYFTAKEPSGSSLLFDANTNKYYKTPSLNNIISVDYPYLKYSSNGNVGVWNLSSEKNIVPPIYEGIAKIDEGYFITNFGQKGIINSYGKLIIPPIYEYIDVYKSVYVVKDTSGLKVYSKSGNRITDRSYKKVNVYADNIKCYDNEMTLIKLENGVIDYIKVFKEYISYTIEKQRFPRQKSTDAIFGGSTSNSAQIATIGWYRPILTRKVKDTVEQYRGNWGLKGENDSIIIPPTFKHVKILPERNLTKAYYSNLLSIRSISSKALKQKGLGISLSPSTMGIFQSPFILIDHAAGKKVGKERFSHINFSDFHEAELARAFNNNLSLVNNQIEIIHKNLIYYGYYSDNLLPICKSGERILKQTETHNTVSSTVQFLDNTGAIHNTISPYEKFLEIKNGSWFYINNEGEIVNENAFQQAGQFKKGKAIVKQDNKWGVIDTNMQIIIPFEYSKIKRIEIKDSTYFQLFKRVNEHYIYTRKTGTIVSTPIRELSDYSEGNWFARKKGSDLWGVLDTNLKVLSDYTYNQYRPFKNGHAMVIKGNKKTLLNGDTQPILPLYKAKNISPIGYEYYAISGKKGIFVISATGDTLIQEGKCKKIIATNKDYILYENRSREIEFLHTNESIKLPKETRIESYNLASNRLLLSKNGKQKIWSITEQKYIFQKLSNIIELGDDSFVYKGENGMMGYMSYDGDTLTKPAYKELAPIKNGWGYVNKERIIIDKNGKALFESNIFRLRPQEDNFLIYTQSGVGLINKDAQLIVPAKYQTIELYNSLFFKAKHANGTFDLFTIKGKKITDKPFNEVKAIDENALIVRDKGYDYLYEDGYLNKSLSFQRIRPISSGKYLLDETWLTGLFNSSGESIIPVQYHKIVVIQNYFQVGFFNSFGYYNQEGKVLAEPKRN